MKVEERRGKKIERRGKRERENDSRIEQNRTKFAKLSVVSPPS